MPVAKGAAMYPVKANSAALRELLIHSSCLSVSFGGCTCGNWCEKKRSIGAITATLLQYLSSLGKSYMEDKCREIIQSC